jgi:hypothetical protein
MTYQTSPQMPWIFPDQAYQMNHRGTIPEVAMTPLDAVVGSTTSWLADAQRKALDKVKNTHNSQMGMEGKLNTTARSQRYMRPASRSAVPNGVFEGSPMTYTTSGNAFRGGVITTKEGQEWLAKRLKERATEYGALATGQPVKTERLEVSPYTEINLVLSQLFSAFSAGSWTSTSVDYTSKLLQSLLKNGAKFQPSDFGDYARSVSKLIETVRPYVGIEHGRTRGFTFEPTEERLRLIDQIYKNLQLCEQVVKEIARTIYDSQSVRDQTMASLSSRLLGAQLQAYNPASSGPERQSAIQGVEAPQLGQGPSFFQPRPVEVVPFAAEEGEAPLAMDEREAYAPDLEEQAARMEGLGKRRGRPRKYKY